MPLIGLPVILENILDVLLKDTDLTSWYMKSESDFTQLTVRFRNMAATDGQSQTDCKYKKMTPSQMTRDKSRCAIWKSRLNPEADIYTGQPINNGTLVDENEKSCDIPVNQQDSQQYQMAPPPASMSSLSHATDQQYDSTRPKQKAEPETNAILPSDCPPSPRLTRRQARLNSSKPLTNQPSPVVGQVDGAYDSVPTPRLPSQKRDRPSGGKKDYAYSDCKELQGDTWQRALYDKMCRLADGGKDEGHG